MRSPIKISKGLDIPLAGKPEQVIHAGQRVTSVALLGTDYPGLQPRLLVDAGQKVALGEPLFFDKRYPAIQYTAPGSGRIKAVNRGSHRILQSLVIELDDGAAAERTFSPDKSADPTALRDLLWQSGAWTSFRTRPFNRVPAPTDKPDAIFITAIDTRPLAPDPRVIIAGHRAAFATGMHIIAQLTEQPVYLCTATDWSGPEPANRNIVRVEFTGPHPAGLPGTHIHYLCPVLQGRTVWHIDYQNVIAIGHLFETGRIFTERTVAVGGAVISKPRLLRTRIGASIAELLQDELHPSRKCRVIAGSVLDGTLAEGPMAYLGRHTNQITVIPDDVMLRRPGWLNTRSALYDIVGKLSGRQATPHDFATVRNGRKVAMLPYEGFERVMPLDILPTPLLRALLIGDTDTAQSLGCLQLAEEDLALCAYVCPAKQDYGAALRANLEQIAQEG